MSCFRLLDKILCQVFPLTESTAALIRRNNNASNDAEKVTETETSTMLLLGAIGASRQLLLHLADLGENLEEAEAVHERSLQLYELCLHLVRFRLRKIHLSWDFPFPIFNCYLFYFFQRESVAKGK